jgi:alpha-L-fucosidase
MIPKINVVLCLLLSVATGFPSTNFQPTVKSLQQYEAPEWFRDAKFGIYVHWGVYSVAEMGEWYGRNMYEEGSSTYAQHIATYGHPSKFGYKDLIPLWQAEHFDPEARILAIAHPGADDEVPARSGLPRQRRALRGRRQWPDGSPGVRALL